MKILFVGDIYGRPGREALRALLPQLKRQYALDAVLANGENAAGGTGLTPDVAQELFLMGVDGLTLGNHAWSKKEVFGLLESDDRVVRPGNYPPGTIGRGSTVIDIGCGRRVGLINLMGRTFMTGMDCPFRTADTLIASLRDQVEIIIVDIHAEATSEKNALGWYLDGRVSAVIGTHTHVLTADERVLPEGTGFITDAGMTGPRDSVIGVDRKIIIERFLTGLPARFEVAEGPVQLNGVIVEVDESTGRALRMIRIREELGSTGNGDFR